MINEGVSLCFLLPHLTISAIIDIAAVADFVANLILCFKQWIISITFIV